MSVTSQEPPDRVGQSRRHGDSTTARLRVAILLSTRYFEDFYGREMGLSRAEYLDGYRNDWSWKWCELLRSQGAESTIYLPSIAEAGAHRTRDGFHVRFLALGAIARPWVALPVLERSPVGRYVGQTVNAAAFLRPLRGALEADEIDVLCIQEYWTARFDVLVRGHLNRPIVAIDQGLPDRHEVKLLKRRSFHHTAVVITQTESEAARVRRFGGLAERLPNAVDSDLFHPPEETVVRGACEGRRVLAVARLHDAQKRLSDLVRALALLPSDWELQIAGTGPDRDMLEGLADRLGVASRVQFLGFIGSQEALLGLYQHCSVFAMPSAYEGLPVALLEAMSCGAAVVGSEIRAIAEVVTQGVQGLLVPVGDPTRLAGALVEAETKGAQLGAAGRELVLTQYSHTVIAPRLAALLRSTASRSPQDEPGLGAGHR